MNHARVQTTEFVVEKAHLQVSFLILRVSFLRKMGRWWQIEAGDLLTHVDSLDIARGVASHFLVFIYTVYWISYAVAKNFLGCSV